MPGWVCSYCLKVGVRLAMEEVCKAADFSGLRVRFVGKGMLTIFGLQD